MKLPSDYVEEMKNLLKEDYYLYEQALEKEKHVGIRINTGKISVEKFIEISPFELIDIPYIYNGFIIKDTDAVSKHPYYYAGLYYIQEPSAMIPASCIEVNENDRVLDLCAAPGGKTTEIISQNPAFVLSNDISYSRTIPLVKNMELFGARSYAVTAESPERLSGYYNNYFDKILVDAPCSGEGMFRKDSALINAWINKRPAEYAIEQEKILNEALKMLKPGGTLIYSTCTFSKCEDEEIIGKILIQNENVHIEKIDKYEGFSDGFLLDEYKDFDFTKCVRIFPHRIEGEGHFIAKLVKDEGIIKNLLKPEKDIKYIDSNKLPDKVKEFLIHVKNEKLSNIFMIKDDLIYMLTDEVKNNIKKSLHYSRTGMLLGQLKKGIHFSVNSPFALTLGFNDFDNVLSLKPDDLRTIKYLKGETIFSEDFDKAVNKGYVMICVDDYPLGFAQFDGYKYKNLYPQGWRYNGK